MSADQPTVDQLLRRLQLEVVRGTLDARRVLDMLGLGERLLTASGHELHLPTRWGTRTLCNVAQGSRTVWTTSPPTCGLCRRLAGGAP